MAGVEPITQDGGQEFTLGVPAGAGVLATVIAVGSRPAKGPVTTSKPWYKLGQTLHANRFWLEGDGTQEVTFHSTTNIAYWVGFMQAYTSPAWTAHVAVTACSRNGDKVCGKGSQGTPGVLPLPALDCLPGQVVSTLLMCHDDALDILPPAADSVAGFVVHDSGMFMLCERTAPGALLAEDATTTLPNFIHGVTMRTAVGL